MGLAIGNKIKAARKAAGFSMMALAQEIGATRTEIGEWEAGISKPRRKQLVSLADVLKVPVDELAGVAKTRERMKPAAAKTKMATVSAAGTAGAKKPDERQLRSAIIETALAMSRTGLSPGRSGNVSARWKAGMLITPSGMVYEDLKPKDIVFVDGNGATSRGARTPSSEWRFHLAGYEVRADCRAIVHSHSTHATVLACAHKPIPAFHYMIAVAGGMEIPLVPYATFGTDELSAHVRGGLADHAACLMANHGQIATGKSLAAALELAHEVECLASQYYKVLTLGEPHILGAEEMQTVLEKFKNYGQKF